MALPRKAIYMVLGGILALALVFGAAAIFAQDSGDATELGDTTPEQTTPELEPEGSIVPPFAQWDRRDRVDIDWDEDEALAEALGITVENLQEAREQVRTTLIEQAVADGLLTQEQADALLENTGRFHRGFGHGNHFGFSGNADELLAGALGISVEALEEARAEVRAAHLTALVDAGIITQEEADMMMARVAVQSYIDREALQALIQETYEAAVAQAVEDGAITQEQADALLRDPSTMGFGLQNYGAPGGKHGFGGGRGFHGGPPRGFFGGSQNGLPGMTDPAAGA